MMVVLAETAVTAEVHDGGQFSFHDQNVAAMFGIELATHWGQRRQLIKMSFNGPVAGNTEHPEFLEGNRLQCLDHLPFGSNGSREPPEVAETVTVF